MSVKNRLKEILDERGTKNVWDSTIEASKELNISHQNITKCCQRKRNHAGSYMWVYKSNYLENIEIIKPYKNKQGEYNKKKVIQLTINEDFIQEWVSIAEAAKNLNLYPSNICKSCQNKYNLSGGFKWMYKEDYEKYYNMKNTYYR